MPFKRQPHRSVPQESPPDDLVNMIMIFFPGLVEPLKSTFISTPPVVLYIDYYRCAIVPLQGSVMLMPSGKTESLNVHRTLKTQG